MREAALAVSLACQCQLLPCHGAVNQFLDFVVGRVACGQRATGFTAGLHRAGCALTGCRCAARRRTSWHGDWIVLHVGRG